VGCGAIVHTSRKGDGRVINIEGDPDHVINRGSTTSSTVVRCVPKAPLWPSWSKTTAASPNRCTGRLIPKNGKKYRGNGP
jgi:hypothetical protein